MLCWLVYWQNFPHSALSLLRPPSASVSFGICLFRHYWLLPFCQHLLLEAQQFIPRSCWVFHFHIWRAAHTHAYIDRRLIDWLLVTEMQRWGRRSSHWSCWLRLSRSEMALTYTHWLKEEKADEACISKLRPFCKMRGLLVLNRVRLVELCRPSPAERRSEPHVKVKDGDDDRCTA